MRANAKKASARSPLSTHLDAKGRVLMVDVGGKDVTARTATASCVVRMAKTTLARLRSGDTPKGDLRDVLATARIAGIQAAKQTPSLIPLCHTIALTAVRVEIDLGKTEVTVRATCETRDRTGVEMEAMVAASVAGLTLYDMLKGIDRGITLEAALLAKDGGKSGSFRRGRT